MKTKRQERENLGVDLYGVQQELARHQMMLEKHHDQYAQTKLARTQTEQKLGDVRDMYKNTQLNVNNERKKGWFEYQGFFTNSLWFGYRLKSSKILFVLVLTFYDPVSSQLCTCHNNSVVFLIEIC